MESRRRWSKLYPVVSLRSLSRYDDVLIKVFNGNPAISAATMRDFLLRGYQINVGVVELEQWINVARSHYASTVFAYDDLLRGCYNVQPTMDAGFVCGKLSDSGVDCTVLSMQCWLLLQSPIPNVRLTDYSTFIAGWEMDCYDDFLRGCCVALPGVSAIRLRKALMQSMGVKCRLAHMVKWMTLNPRLCKVARPRKKKTAVRKKDMKRGDRRVSIFRSYGWIRWRAMR